MSERDHITGLGLALTDVKTWMRQYSPLPNKEKELLNLLDRDRNFSYFAGGTVPNTLTAYSRFTEKHVLFLGSVGNDARGQYYQRNSDTKLGKLQVHPTDPTGVVFQVLDQEDGSLVDKKSVYGASLKVTAPMDMSFDNASNYFITNATVFSLPEVFSEVKKVYDDLRKGRNGLFILNCGGARPDRTTRELLTQLIYDHKMVPDIVIGNEAEMCYVANSTSYEDAINILFPNSRIVILTRAGKGSLVRFDGCVLSPIPAYPVQSGEKLDDTGAGDCYLGVLLGALSQIPNNRWKTDDILKASHTAAYSASSVISHPTTQLSQADAKNARNFFINLIKKNDKDCFKITTQKENNS